MTYPESCNHSIHALFSIVFVRPITSTYQTAHVKGVKIEIEAQATEGCCGRGTVEVEGWIPRLARHGPRRKRARSRGLLKLLRRGTRTVGG